VHPTPEKIGSQLARATKTIAEIFYAASKPAQTMIRFVESYSWLALGYFGRVEMCPYSDIEFGVVYEVLPNSSANFHKLYQPLLYGRGQLHTTTILHTLMEANSPNIKPRMLANGRKKRIQRQLEMDALPCPKTDVDIVFTFQRLRPCLVGLLGKELTLNCAF